MPARTMLSVTRELKATATVEFAAGVGQVSFADPGDDDAAAFGTNFEAAQICGGAAQGLVSGVEAVLHARVGGAVQAMGAE